MKSNNIRSLRESKGISIRDLEKLTGISRANLSRVERGRLELYAGWKARIETALGSEVQEFGEEFTRKSD